MIAASYHIHLHKYYHSEGHNSHSADYIGRDANSIVDCNYHIVVGASKSHPMGNIHNSENSALGWQEVDMDRPLHPVVAEAYRIESPRTQEPGGSSQRALEALEASGAFGALVESWHWGA